MAMNKKDIFAVTAAAILLVGLGAGASAYYINYDDIHSGANAAEAERVSYTEPAAGTTRQVQTQQVQQAPAQPACDDDNIVGKVIGGVGGGLIGNQIGKGNGNTAATIGGSVGGTLLGEEYIPTRNVTCR